jgi:hypothetical protein
MANDNKGIGKEYNPDDFSKPVQEAGGSKKHTAIGVAVILVVALAGAGVFLINGNSGGDSNGITAATIVAYCADSDGGYNRFTKGVAVGTSALDYSEGEWKDKCAGEGNKLTEYYCKNDLVVFTTEPCPEGMVCTDGICTT